MDTISIHSFNQHQNQVSNRELTSHISC